MQRLPDLLESVARVRVKVAGVFKGARREIDFKSTDASVTITATDDGVNERMTLDFAAGGSGSNLWESVGADLHPIDPPDSFTVTTTGDGDATIDTSDSAGDGSTGNIFLLSDGGQIGLFTGNFGGTNRGPIEISSASDLTATSYDGDITLTAGPGPDDALQNVTVQAEADVTIVAGHEPTTGGALQLQAQGNVYVICEGFVINEPGTGTPSISGIPTSFAFYIDEGGNNLKVKVCYADGSTVKTGTIALV